jgi:hypothetical protein
MEFLLDVDPKSSKEVALNYVNVYSIALAIQYNQRSIFLYYRMKGRGRNGKQALTAVIHELALNIFRAAKSGQDYDPNYMENRKLTA